MCYLIFTCFPERYQMVIMPSRQVRTPIHIKTGQSAKPHGQWNRDSDPGHLSWQQPILIIIVISLPLLNVKKKKKKSSISLHLFTFSFFHCTIRAKQIHVKLIPLKVLEFQPLSHYVIRYTSKSRCLQSQKSKIVLTCGSRERSLLISDSQTHRKGTL